MPDINSYDVISRGVYNANVSVRSEECPADFLRTILFGGGESFFDEEFYEYDSMLDANNQIAEEAIRGADPQRVNFHSGFNAKHIDSLYYFVKDSTTYRDAIKRVFNESLSNPFSKEQRITYHLVKKKEGNAKTFMNALEKACSDVLITGKYTARNGGEQTFPITKSLLSLSGADLLTNPLETLGNAIDKVEAKNGRVEMMIFNYEDWNALVSSEAFIKLIDAKIITIDSSTAYVGHFEDGSVGRGLMTVKGRVPVEIRTYAAVLNKTAVWPKGKIYVGPKTIGKIVYCGVPVNDGSGIPQQLGVKIATAVYPENQFSLQSNVILEVASAPSPCPTAIDKWGIITGVPASA